MSGTFRIGVVAMTSLLALVASSCTENGDKSATPQEYVDVCVIKGYYFAQVTEAEAKRHPELYSADKKPCREADRKEALRLRKQLQAEKQKWRHERERVAATVHAATAAVSGRTRKLFAVINLACRQKGMWLPNIYIPYDREYRRYWYPSQAVAFPYELSGALRKACPSREIYKPLPENGSG